MKLEECNCHCHSEEDLPDGVQCKCIKNCRHCHPENFKWPEWEDEFDQVFGTNLWREHRYKDEYKGEIGSWTTCAEEVKAFIRKHVNK